MRGSRFGLSMNFLLVWDYKWLTFLLQMWKLFWMWLCNRWVEGSKVKVIFFVYFGSSQNFELLYSFEIKGGTNVL